MLKDPLVLFRPLPVCFRLLRHQLSNALLFNIFNRSPGSNYFLKRKIKKISVKLNIACSSAVKKFENFAKTKILKF